MALNKTHLLIGAAIAVVLAVTIGWAVFHFMIRETRVIDYADEAYTWNALAGTSRGDLLVRGEKVDEIRDDVEKLIHALNRSDKDPEGFRVPEGKEPADLPKLKLLDSQKGRVTVEVINAEILTQRMGSTGASAFLAVATFTLTEHADIDAVKFVFKEGDHAIPGIYQREMFRRYWRIDAR